MPEHPAHRGWRRASVAGTARSAEQLAQTITTSLMIRVWAGSGGAASSARRRSSSTKPFSTATFRRKELEFGSEEDP